MNTKFDTKAIMDQTHKHIKAEYGFDIRCTECGEFVGNYTHDYLKEKGELFCEICKDVFLVNIEYNKK